jgi:hypothetical protein
MIDAAVVIDLGAVFDQLERPPANSGVLAFSACRIPRFEQHRLAKDAEGVPSILLSVSDGQGIARPAPVVLENLSVQYDVLCRISEPNNVTEDGQFTIVSCTGTDPALHSYFLRIVGAVVLSLGALPSRAEIARSITKLVELFQAMAAPPRKSVQSLWAELMVIARAAAARELVKAWHLAPDDRYDFSAGNHRIEVKSAQGRVRHHHFSLEQLQPPSGTTVLIASMFIERAGAGVSLTELIDEVRNKVAGSPDLLLHVDRVVGVALGDSWRVALEERFDRQLAEASLRFYEPSAIPSVNPDLPHGVSEVRFKADLSASATADLSRYRNEGGLFRSALRR